MPIPLILGAAAAAAGLIGAGAGISGGMKMKEANDTIEAAQSRHRRNISSGIVNSSAVPKYPKCI